jgi:hypothetical protein
MAKTAYNIKNATAVLKEQVSMSGTMNKNRSEINVGKKPIS